MTEREERYAKAIALLDEWMRDESGYDERVYPLIEAALRGQEQPMDPETVTIEKWIANAALKLFAESGKSFTVEADALRTALSPPKCEHPPDQLEPRLYADGIGVFKCKACGATAPAVPGEWSGP